MIFIFLFSLILGKGINRIGNLLVPNDNYVKFEDWMLPILDAMLLEQKETGVVWTPSKVIARLGKEINDESSIYYWASKNNIPVFSPALTDGSIGDMMFFHSFKNPGFVLDILQGIELFLTYDILILNLIKYYESVRNHVKLIHVVNSLRGFSKGTVLCGGY